MSLHAFAGFILLAVFALVLGYLGNRAFGGMPRLSPKVRARNLAPPSIQQQRMVRAAFKRLFRGLRFPTVAQKQAHQRFKNAYHTNVQRVLRNNPIQTPGVSGDA